MVKRFQQFWNQAWFSSFDPVSLGLFRISLGLLMTFFYIAIFPNWDRYYSDHGVLSLHDPYFQIYSKDIWNLFYLTEGFLPPITLWITGFLCALAFTVGWQTRLSTVVLFVIHSSLIHRALIIVNGEDLVVRMLLFYGCFAPLNHCLSIDAWIKKRKRPQNIIANQSHPWVWPMRLMQVNVCLIYVISLPNKLVDDISWWNGDAIYLSIVNSLWSRFPWPQLFYAWDGLLTKLFTYGTIVVEGLFPFLVWLKKPKIYVIFSVVCLHTGIAFILKNVAFFSLSMVCSFWLFVPPELSRFLLAKIAAKFRQNRLLLKLFKTTSSHLAI